MQSAGSSMKRFKIAQLKEKLRQLEKPILEGVDTGFPEIDHRLTAADGRHSSAARRPVLSRGAVHHVVPQTMCDLPAALGFAIHLTLQIAQHHMILWTQTPKARHEWGEPYLPGLLRHGVGVDQFLYVGEPSARDWLWVLEEAGACADVGCVLGLCAQKELSFTATRRLSLCVQKAITTMVLVSPAQHQALATATQWEVSAAADEHWRVLLKRRAGAALPPPHPWLLKPAYAPAAYEWPSSGSPSSGLVSSTSHASTSQQEVHAPRQFIQ